MNRFLVAFFLAVVFVSPGLSIADVKAPISTNKTPELNTATVLRTALGTLVRVKKVNAVPMGIEVIGMGTWMDREDMKKGMLKPRPDNVYIALHFQGNVPEQLHKDLRGIEPDVKKNCYLKDSSGEEYRLGLIVRNHQDTIIAYEVPKGSSGFVWYDGETKHSLRSLYSKSE